MNRRYRLTQSADFKRVRRRGKSFAHPLIVLVALPNELGKSRFAVVAGRNLGNAVKRNRAKRLLRAALRPLVGSIGSGWDIILIARLPLLDSNSTAANIILKELIQRAELFRVKDDLSSPPSP